MALCYIPNVHIKPLFEDLAMLATCESLKDLIAYIGLERKSCPIENNIYLTKKKTYTRTLRNVSKTSFVRGSEMLKIVTFKAGMWKRKREKSTASA